MNKKSGSLLAALCVAAGTCAAGPMYRCANGNTSYWSDKPCTNHSLGSVGPAPQSGTTYAQPMRGGALTVSRAPDYLQYLSPACASLHDAIRTASSRGIGVQTQLDLRTEYQAKCSEEDAAARRRDAEDKSAQRDQRKAEVVAQQTQRSEAAATREQCNEMLRILHERKKRWDAMSAGERSDLQRFEANYRDRCPR